MDSGAPSGGCTLHLGAVPREKALDTSTSKVKARYRLLSKDMSLWVESYPPRFTLAYLST